MSGSDTTPGEGEARRRFSPGIRMKLFGFLLPLVFLLIVTVAFAVTEITEFALRRDLLQRGAAISRVVALSAGYSLLSGDRLALDRLAAETRASAPDIVFVAIRDVSDIGSAEPLSSKPRCWHPSHVAASFSPHRMPAMKNL